MENVKNVIFDFGGVLLDWNPRYLYREYFADEREMEYFLAEVCTGEWNLRLDGGRSFDEAVATLQQQWPRYREPIAMFRDGWERMLKDEIPASVALLRELKAAGYGIYGLTNWSAETIGFAYRRFDFFRLFDGIVVSGEEKVVKPERRIYEILLARYALRPEECVFIDDNQANIDAATQLGIRTVLFDDADSVRSRLAPLLSR